MGRVWVAGELSNLFHAASGHVYFTLKDDDAQLRAALFRNAARRVPFELEEGQEVLAYGDASVYPARGELQLVVRQLEPRGLGALQLALEQLRRRLEAEGLFAAERKRPLPEHPRRVGVVTSGRGAAVRDVIQVSGRRYPAATLVVSETRVQGDGADLEIAEALERVVAHGEVDVVLVVRGGGSFEDLMAFNSEAVVRAIVDAPVPVVSGVGHETDVTLADLAADVRAPTPSAAAVVALPDRAALVQRLGGVLDDLEGAARGRLLRLRTRLDRERDALRALAPSARLAAQRARFEAARRALTQGWERTQWRRRSGFAAVAARLLAAPPDLEKRALRLASATRALTTGVDRRRAEAGARLAEAVGRLEALSPLGVVARGYGLVRRAADGAIVRDASQVALGDELDLTLARAEIRARVERARPRTDEPT